MNRDNDSIVSFSALSKVVGLEVECGLRKSISVSDVVHRVDDIESVNACGVQILGERRGLKVVVSVVEV